VFDVLTLNAISPRGLARLPRDKYRVGAESAAPDAILVRSFNLHDREIPASVRAIGRAGAGVNNIPVAAMTARGIPVFNAPGANANAVKELVIAGLIIGCRHLCRAWDFSRTLTGDDEALHKAVEAGKKQFAGTEISGRTLGVIGLGAIGRNVAMAASALGMHVVGFDPGLTMERAARLTSAIRRVEALDELLAASEFLTVHVPLTEETRDLISTDQIAKMPSNAIILNFAREGIVDERAVLAALDASRLSAYVSDFPTKLTHTHPRCVTFPHLGASTDEAEENCAIMVAEQIRDFLEQGHVHNSVNFPEVELPRASPFRIICATSSQANTAGQVADAIRAAGFAVAGMASVSRGELSYFVADLDAQPGDELMQAIGAQPGVLMARRL